MKLAAVTLTLALPFLIPSSPLSAAEAFEVASERETDLPKGKEADGILGDFVLRNDKVIALISQNSPGRRANMSTFYGDDGVTPGALYDLTLKGADNDQLVIYSPCGHGRVSYVKTVGVREAGSAAVESVTTAAKNNGVFKRHEYRVRDGAQGVFITTILRNESDTVRKVSTRDDLTKFDNTGTVEGGIRWVDSTNPAHHCGYALVTLSVTGIDKLQDSIELKPTQEVVISRFFAVGTSPAQAIGEALHARGDKVAPLTGNLSEVGDQSKPIITATLNVPFGKQHVPGYTDAKGRFDFKLPPGEVQLIVQDLGRKEFTWTRQAPGEKELFLDPPAAIRFAITSEDGTPLPCKAHFTPLDETAPKLDLGPKWRAHGCVDQYHSENGHFTQQLPPGKYHVVVVRGPEYSHLARDITVEAGKTVEFKGTLKRLVDTRGWISADFHNHSTPSGDNVCDTDGRLINLAAEHIEFAPTTEHNRFYDWAPEIKALGLEAHIKTVKGIELTGRRQHVNAFPFEPVPFTQNSGAPDWNDDPRITVLTLRRWQGERADRWIQFNHPDLSNMFVDRDSDGIADGGFIGVGNMIDGTETQNGSGTNILAEAPYTLSRPKGSLATKASLVREFAWRQLLNQGLRVTAVTAADSHSVYGNGVGCWRCYLPSSTDNPADINWAELSPHAKAGHIVLSTGPFLQVTTQNGKIAGDDDRANGGIDLKVRVQCTDWMDIDRIQVLVNSRPDPKLNFTRKTHPQMFKDSTVKFDHTLRVPLQHDAHLIVVAINEGGDEKICYGTSDYAKIRPCAYNNPIYVDTDGHGFTPNGDTLGYDLPVGGMNADKAKALLSRAGLLPKEGHPQPAKEP